MFLFFCTKQSIKRFPSLIPLVQIIDEFRQESLQWPWYWLISSFTVEPLYNVHLGDRRKWPLETGWNKSECMDCLPKTNGRCREVPIGGGSTTFRKEIIKPWLKEIFLFSWRMQLAVDVQIPDEFGGLNGEAIYIGTCIYKY